MKFIADPPIATKIQAMHERVRWRDPALLDRQVEQTHLVLDDDRDGEEFSFLVIGDSGSGEYGGYDPQYEVARQMALHKQDARFVLHTGDVIYIVGSREYYQPNFIKPYRDFLKHGNYPESIAPEALTFDLPFFLVPGNHDYYDLPWHYGLLLGGARWLRRWFPWRVDLSIGWKGSDRGDAYARAFIDCLDRFSDPTELADHLDRHYAIDEVEPGQFPRCLRYEPGAFTRLPNRYYSFRAGGIDFFALDSNTFNAPEPPPAGKTDGDRHRTLRTCLAELERERCQLLQSVEHTHLTASERAERLNELRGELERLDEIRRDIRKQLEPNTTDIDREQLDWLERRLIASWRDGRARGRILFFHHPPYVTEASKWPQEQTRSVRQRLRIVLNKVAAAIGWQLGDRPIVDIVFNGHAHCLEHLQTLDTGHGDSHINWIVCGGSGYSLRRQRPEGPDLEEHPDKKDFIVARSKLFVGKSGHGSGKRRPYSFLRVDVRTGNPPKFSLRPYVSERYQQEWKHYALEPFSL